MNFKGKTNFVWTANKYCCNTKNQSKHSIDFHIQIKKITKLNWIFYFKQNLLTFFSIDCLSSILLLWGLSGINLHCDGSKKKSEKNELQPFKFDSFFFFESTKIGSMVVNLKIDSDECGHFSYDFIPSKWSCRNPITSKNVVKSMKIDLNILPFAFSMWFSHLT